MPSLGRSDPDRFRTFDHYCSSGRSHRPGADFRNHQLGATFEEALIALLRKDAPGLSASASTIGRLKEAW